MSLLSVLGHVLNGFTDSDRHRFVAIVYSDSDVVLSVFRQLGALEKALVGRLLLLDRSIKESLLMHWAVVPGSMSAAVRQLSDLSIIKHESRDNAGEQLFDMEPNFRKTLHHAISSMGIVDPITILVHCQKSLTGTSQKFFFQHAPQVPLGVSKWHSLLERIISPTTSVQSPTDIDRVISRLGFGAYPPPPNAYKFVLSDTCSQLWTLISEFFSVIETTTPQALSIEAMALCLRLVVGVMIQTHITESFICTTLGSESDLTILSRTLGFLEDLDVIKRSRSVSPRTSSAFEFTIGPVASGLARQVTSVSDKNLSNLLVGAQLIVDSNMHVTAYTQSNLQNKLIGLFCSMQRMLCGKFLVGILTRESVQRAIEAGVSSDTICNFLAANLHSKCGQSLPQNVVNQLRIWESDYPRNRIKMEPVVVLSWRLDRSEQTNRAIEQIKHKIDPYNGLLFTKIDEATGKIHLGVKADIAREYLLGT